MRSGATASFGEPRPEAKPTINLPTLAAPPEPIAPTPAEIRAAITPTTTSTIRHPKPQISPLQMQEEINRIKAMSAATTATKAKQRRDKAEMLGFGRESPAFQSDLRGY